MSVDSAIAAATTCTSSIGDERTNEIIFITLGDGDFTWSLDLGRYLLHTSSSMMDDTKRKTGIPKEYNAIRLIVTGIDSLKEFQEKYRNYNYVLRELEQLNTKSRTNATRLHVEVIHEVNAIIHNPNTNSRRHPQGHVVIFNHPHLGTEDAKLHRQFLGHLFHSVHQFWMIPSAVGGVFHLTLANGQYERWECHTAAQRHGMKLVQQSVFVPNPAMAGWTSVYGHRRHQTGKSFASRTNGSTTYSFVRECDGTANNINGLAQLRLPWLVINDKVAADEKASLQSFVCTLCNKQFMEERSLKNHVTSVHNNKRKRSDSDTAKYVCDHCNLKCFVSSEALRDHIIAKHRGIHSTIVPDWVARPTTTSLTVHIDTNSTQHVGTCTICDAVFKSTDDATNHYKLFIPSVVDTMGTAEMRQCRFCQKSFGQIRAQQQHENFCSLRLR